MQIIMKEIKMEDIRTLIKKRLPTYRVIHFTIVMASVVYGGLIYYISQYAPIPPTLTDMQMITKLEYAAIPLVIAIVVITKMMRTKMLSSDSIFIRKQEYEADIEQPAFLGNYLSILFILWAIIEIMAIAGIVLFLTTGILTTSLALIALTAFFQIINGPNFEELNKLSAKYESMSLQGA